MSDNVKTKTINVTAPREDLGKNAIFDTKKSKITRDYPDFADIYYLGQGIIVSVRGFHQPSLPKLAGFCFVKSKSNYKVH